MLQTFEEGAAALVEGLVRKARLARDLVVAEAAIDPGATGASPGGRSAVRVVVDGADARPCGPATGTVGPAPTGPGHGGSAGHEPDGQVRRLHLVATPGAPARGPEPPRHPAPVPAAPVHRPAGDADAGRTAAAYPAPDPATPAAPGRRAGARLRLVGQLCLVRAADDPWPGPDRATAAQGGEPLPEANRPPAAPAGTPARLVRRLTPAPDTLGRFDRVEALDAFGAGWSLASWDAAPHLRYVLRGRRPVGRAEYGVGGRAGWAAVVGNEVLSVPDDPDRPVLHATAEFAAHTVLVASQAVC
ncbi:hypothetical protein [Kitasatospora sp. NPDC094011]|uniref:hypothetical protein n=1 Tax=Kitasatospora sp. NPDC094011 TaxID=3364090 RepID=UPI00380936C9